MKRRNDLVQGTEEWLKARWGRIGGTASKGLFVDSDTLALDILSEQLEPFQNEDTFQSKAMEDGHEKEPIARERLNAYLGIELKEVGLLESEECELLFISPDGITDDDEISCEIKSPERKKHTITILQDAIPMDNIRQCIHYFTINPKLKKHYFCSFRPENKLKPLFIKELNRDTKVSIGLKVKRKVMEDRGKGMKEYVATLDDVRTVQEWVDLALSSAKNIEKGVKTYINKLKF